MDDGKLAQMKQFLARLDELEGRILNLRTKTAQIWTDFERALRRQQSEEEQQATPPATMDSEMACDAAAR